MGKCSIIQGVPLKSPPLNFLSTKSLCNLWHLEKFGASLHGILYLENLRGGNFSETPCRSRSAWFRHVHRSTLYRLEETRWDRINHDKKGLFRIRRDQKGLDWLSETGSNYQHQIGLDMFRMYLSDRFRLSASDSIRQVQTGQDRFRPSQSERPKLQI